MKTPYVTLTLVGVGLLLVACTQGTQRKGPKGISAPVYDAFAKAMAAITRANEYRDAGVLLYEPRFLKVERAKDEVSREVRNSKLTNMYAVNETGTWMICDICISALKSYRLTSEHLDRYDPPPPDAVQQLLDAGKRIDSCIKKADEFLH